MQGIPELNRRLNAIQDTQGLMRQVSLLAVAESKALVPRKTGNLARTIRAENITEHGAEIIAGGRNGVGYAPFVEYGTRPHVILPRRGSVLAWPSSAGGRRLSGRARAGAAMAFAKRVNHPGTRPQPFLLPGSKAAIAKAKLANYIIRRWDGAA